jgi:hypothetical protein
VAFYAEITGHAGPLKQCVNDPKRQVAQALRPVAGPPAAIALGCADACKFIRFLAFGLTWCARRLTVTVRNHHHQQTLGQGAKYHAI